ncbi:uncharacterized protein [Amphiura filiformis]|uniref:uncharacterized protein n=1 Tax=Amphiura filiformis TaxID=82378 RepID=UPI003B222886
MDSKRKAAFTAHVLNKLFPPTQAEDDDTRTSDEYSQPRTLDVTQGVSTSSKGKVYGAYLPPEIQHQMKKAAADDAYDDDASGGELEKRKSEDGESSTENEDNEYTPKKRKRNKRRKHKMETYCGASETRNEDSNDINSDCGVKQISSNSDNTKSLTKNQKRKMRKKKRRMCAGNPAEDGPSSEFTFVPREESVDTEPSSDNEEQKKIICMM